MDSYIIKELGAGFSKLQRSERLQRLLDMGILEEEDIAYLKNTDSASVSLAENLIENVIGVFQMPLGIAVNFNIDNQDYVIPMAVEETSIIAAASKTAKWIRENGNITTQSIGNLSIGQIQIAKTKNFTVIKNSIEKTKQYLIDTANQNIACSMFSRGGGVKDIIVRCIPRGEAEDMVIIHILIDTCEAMGANIINQTCEYLKPFIEQITQEKVNMCILSNLVDSKLTRAEVIINQVEPSLAEAIVEASLFAQLDPYRAATNNKGTLNGMDPIVIATGNDWRAVEAGIHAYTALDGQYSSITKWKKVDNQLIGTLEAPINVGTIGGVTKVHPTARLCLKMLRVTQASHLARIIAAVGLVQNLGAIKALVTEGITKGHMRLHLTNMALAVGATEAEIYLIKDSLEQLLTKQKKITQSDVSTTLTNIRNHKPI